MSEMSLRPRPGETPEDVVARVTAAAKTSNLRTRPFDQLMVDELRRTLASIMDVVESMALGAAAGEKVDAEWAELVASTFAEHRREIGVT